MSDSSDYYKEEISDHEYYLDGFAVLSDILASRGVIIPEESTTLEIFGLGSPHHPEI